MQRKSQHHFEHLIVHSTSSSSRVLHSTDLVSLTTFPYFLLLSAFRCFAQVLKGGRCLNIAITGGGGGKGWRGSLREHAGKVSIFHSFWWSRWQKRQLQKLKKAKSSEKKTSAGCQKARILFREAKKKTRQVEKENSWESNKILLERERTTPTGIR